MHYEGSEILPNLASVLTRYEFAINLKIAKAPGLGVPLSLLATADEGN